MLGTGLTIFSAGKEASQETVEEEDQRKEGQHVQ
jgi:hypothetical protein